MKVLLVTAGLSLLLALNHILFLGKIENNVIHLDWWRFVNLIDHYHSGTLDFETLISPTNHHSIAVPTVFLIDGVLFDLDLRSLLFLPIPLLLLASWVMAREYRRILPEHLHNTWRHCALLVPLIVLMIPLYYAWLFMCGPSAFNMVRVASYCLAFVYFSSLLRKERLHVWDYLFSVVAVFFLIDVIGQGSSVLFGMTVLLTMGFAIVVEKKYKSHTIYLVLMSLAVAAATVIFAKLTKQTSRGMGENIAYVFEHPRNAFEYLLLSAHNSLFGVLLSGHTTVQLSIGGIVLGLYVLATIKLVHSRIWKRSYVPVMLLIFPWAFIALTMISRLVVFGDDIRSPIRYIADTNLGIIAIYTILSTSLWHNPNSRHSSISRPRQVVYRAHATALAGFVCLVILSQSVSFQKQWVIADRLENKFAAMRKKMTIASRRTVATRQFSRMLNVRTHLVDSYARDALKTMQQYRLSIFEDIDPPRRRENVARRRRRRSENR